MKTNTITLNQITVLQEQYSLTKLQDMINSGLCWQMEGHVGRTANQAIEDGACMLPEERHSDYYGSIVPSRIDLKEGTKGTLENCKEFWQKVIDGEIDLEMELDV